MEQISLSAYQLPQGRNREVEFSLLSGGTEALNFLCRNFRFCGFSKSAIYMQA
jgi:hypothetical protein